MSIILDLIFPPKCFYCKKGGNVICKDCLEKIHFPYLLRKVNHDWVNYVFCSSFYQGEIRTQIHSFKFHEKSYLYQYLIAFSLRKKRIVTFLKKFDVITYVPMHSRKEKQRGYNQAELLAKELGKRLKKKVVKTLEKKVENKIQSSLTEKERKQNVKNVYSFRKGSNIKGKNVILVDDILTTGATVSACSKALKENGAGKICVFAIAKTQYRFFQK